MKTIIIVSVLVATTLGAAVSAFADMPAQNANCHPRTASWAQCVINQSTQGR